MKNLAVLSMHTSPLAQPGTGDGGGMNVYVRELSASLARSGIACSVFTRAWSPDLPEVIQVEPGFTVHHVKAGPLEPVSKEHLHNLSGEFARSVIETFSLSGEAPDAIHANYWLSGVAGHTIKHELGLPLVSTFHTLERMKAESGMEGDLIGEVHRAQGEFEVMGCADAIVASCSVEADQIRELYGVDPSRIVVVPPGVDHAFFSPGDRAQARRALGLPIGADMLLFVGRLQPLKGATIAVEALEILRKAREVFLVVVGGPSGPDGDTEVDLLAKMVVEAGLEDQVFFVDPQPHELLSTYYRAADVCVVPSRSESFGLVALEASACGTPVVATGVGGLLTLVDDGITGYLVEGRQPEEFASRIASILEDEAFGRKMSANAALRARRYTWKRSANCLSTLYDRLTCRELIECG